ncbi:RING-type domain-containing protein [Camponotus japonicus]
MDTIICNKCFVSIYKGKPPYNITQCGHIYCQDCLQHVKKQCFQCKYISPAYLLLEKPLMPKKISVLTPFTEILEILLNMEISQSNQLTITMERFRILDDKYEMTKRYYFLLRRNMKILLDKCMYLKTEKKKLDEELLQMMQTTPKSTSNTINSQPSSTISLNTRYSSGSLSHLKFSNLNLSDATDISMQSVNRRNRYKIDDSICIFDNNRLPKTTNLLFHI